MRFCYLAILILLTVSHTNISAQKDQGTFALFSHNSTDYTSPTMSVKMKTNGVDSFGCAYPVFLHMQNKPLANNRCRVVIYTCGCFAPFGSSYEVPIDQFFIPVPEQGGNIPITKFCESLFQCDYPDKGKDTYLSDMADGDYGPGGIGIMINKDNVMTAYWFGNNVQWPTGDDTTKKSRELYSGLMNLVKYMNGGVGVVSDPVCQWGYHPGKNKMVKLDDKGNVYHHHSCCITNEAELKIPVDIRLEINGEVLFDGDIKKHQSSVSVSHSLREGIHRVKLSSVRCDTEFEKEFMVNSSIWTSVKLIYNKTENQYFFDFEKNQY